MIFYVFIFIFGLIVGSFLNVVINRLKNKKSFFKNRSYCPLCKKQLSWQELIPILSFFLQKGKCKWCKKRISIQYPLVELFTGLAFVLIFIYQFTFLNLIIVCFLIVLFVYDFKHYLVPDEIIYPAIVLTLGFRILDLFARPASLGEAGEIWSLVLGALVGGAFFLVIVLISRGKWMGMGDVKIGVLMGLLLGLTYLFTALFLAFLIGAVISGVLLILKKKKLKSEIPFGPFLTGATFITLLWGDFLLNWYLSLFS